MAPKQQRIMSELEKIKKITDEYEGFLPPNMKKNLDKHIGEIEKSMIPGAIRKQQRVSEGAPSGVVSQFSKKKPIVPEMIKFAGWESGSEMSRNDITHAIHSYIKHNNLQVPGWRRDFILDEPLKKLLKCDEEKLSYPHLQKYISLQFVKEVPSLGAEKPVESHVQQEQCVQQEPPVQQQEQCVQPPVQQQEQCVQPPVKQKRRYVTSNKEPKCKNPTLEDIRRAEC